MRTVPANLQTRIEANSSTLTTCLTITRTDSTILRFTDFDRDIVIGSDTYKANVGYTKTAIISGSKMDVDNVEFGGFFSDEGITKEDIRTRTYDFAKAELILVDAAAISAGSAVLRKGILGEFNIISDDTYTCEIRGLTQYLIRTVGEFYQHECRVDLGDSKCGVNLSTLTQSNTVATIVNSSTFTVATAPTYPTITPHEKPEGDNVVQYFKDLEPLTVAEIQNAWFNAGLLTWTSGDNTGKAMEIKQWTRASNTLQLYLPPTSSIAVGDGFNFYPGCDKRRLTCIDKFDNLENFRGEPDLPGTDVILRYPDRR